MNFIIVDNRVINLATVSAVEFTSTTAERPAQLAVRLVAGSTLDFEGNRALQLWEMFTKLATHFKQL